MRKTLNHLKTSRLPLALAVSLAILCVAGALTCYCFEFTPSASAAARQPTCGTVYARIGSTVPTNADANQNEDCFWRAYTTCQPDQSITYQQTGIDTGTIHQFSLVRRGFRCQITDEVRPYTIVGPGSHMMAFYVCSSMYRDFYGLHVQNCQNDGDVLIPTSHSHVVPLPLPRPLQPSAAKRSA
ncbi:hypothetical protein [Dictyobacter formicarum]|uniref:Secreted protein n=1 Tax=Dictyobacter formicarum TaxID=2778368 RepID=A0ABQ3VHS6_9CHLR|nr:hypothetical protein [Dictyobacter formicarum]GHO85378.1 hypothetical protein KSZ_33840 [Dictyobacter formicarum]